MNCNTTHYRANSSSVPGDPTGTIPAGGRAFVTYRVRVGANAREGEQFNTATGTGMLTSGERLSTPTARTPVRVRRGLFSSQQIILGRVFDDANLNGQFDKGERGVPGVRIYLNNGQSVITDSEGLYNFPSVNEGAQVLSLDPVTLADGYRLVETDRRDEQSWTRLLRTPLGGGAMLRQNFALRTPDGDIASTTNAATKNKTAFTADASKREGRTSQPAQSSMKGSLFGGLTPDGNAAAPSSNNNAANGTGGHATNGNVPRKSEEASSLAAGTHELATEETLEPLAPGAVKILSPLQDGTIAGAALEVEARVHGAWKIVVEVEGQRVPESKLGERRVDHKNTLATFRFVGLNVRPGPNRIKVTAIGPAGEQGQTAEVTAFGRGPAKRIEIVTDKPEVAAGGRDRARVRVRAFDQWGRPAADGAVALEVTAGRLVRVEEKNAPSERGDKKNNEKLLNGENPDAPSSQQVLTLTGGEGVVDLIADGEPGEAQIRATTGVLEAEKRVRVIPEVRPAILVGLAEVTVGSGAPELSANDGKDVRSRIAFFYRGQVFGSNNLLTLAYDSNRALNRTAGRDRLFQLDPLERAYPIFGDSSTRFEDAQSNSKLYARLDRGRSYFLFGDFESDSKDAGLASYTRRLTGAKLHLENAAGDFISVSGARPDTAFARDVFEGGSFTFARLTHGELLPGSETIAIEVRDRRNPDIIISREPLMRGIDYNLDPVTGEVFFLRPISTFDFQLNLVQVVATYEYAAAGMSSAVYTGRAFKTFESLGLKLGLSFVDQRQGEFGSFIVGGVDAEKTLPRRGRLTLQWATSRGRAIVGGNIFGMADDDARHDGNAYRAELEQPLPFREATLRASFVRADEGFLNPFGQTVTPGSQRAEGSLEMKVTRTSVVRFALMDERNHTSNVSNSRQTGSLQWTQTFGDKLRTTFGYDFRRFRDELAGTGTDSNLVTVGAEWQATDKLNVSVKREQNLGEADPTYPNQTTLAAKYQWNQFTNIFFTQRLASAPIVPISDAAATGFASVASQRETAIGVETKLGRYANLVSRYQLENGINGTDSFAVIGLSNRFALTKQLSLDLGYERGFHLAGQGESFNSGHFGFLWNPTEDFRANARYELRDRGGLGTILSFGAAGRLGDGLTSLGRFQLSRVRFGGRDTTGLNATAALAWRPLESDRAGLLFSYTRRDLRQGAFENTPETRDRADVLSSDAYYQPTKNTELYGRFALKFGDTASQELARVSTLTYMTQGRFVYHFGRYFDAAAEARLLAQPSTGTRRDSFGAELGYWLMPDLRLGGGYNWTGGVEPLNGSILNRRRGFYFTISSKLSNLFDLFGTSRAASAGAATTGDDAQGAQGKKKDEEEDDEEEEEEEEE